MESLRLINPPTAADILGLSVKRLHQFCREGEIDYVQIDDKQRAFTEKQLQDFVARRTVKSTVDTGNSKAVRLPPKEPKRKGGDARKSGNSAEVADLRREMRQWQ